MVVDTSVVEASFGMCCWLLAEGHRQTFLYLPSYVSIHFLNNIEAGTFVTNTFAATPCWLARYVNFEYCVS